MISLSLVPRDTDRATTATRMIAMSCAMRALVDLADRVAPSNLSVLLLGETGTGKDVLARHIHEHSRRRGAFVAVNCVALPPTLAESELFGHVRGAFTGAERLREGLFEQAHRGTLLLDEIADLDLVVQGKLLRVLEDGAVQRLGSSTSVPVDVRIVAATHRDLRVAVEQGRFREDLYYRLAGVTLTVPPLRDRLDDIAPLAERFIADEADGGVLRQLAPATLDWLRDQSWRGNVRELRQAVRRAVALGGRELRPEDFMLAPAIAPVACIRPIDASIAEKTWNEIEREVIVEALRRHGSIRAAAVALGRPKSTLADRARRYGISGDKRNR